MKVRAGSAQRPRAGGVDRRADAIVSPANSFGYMDGGLDLVYSQFFGWELEARVRRELLKHHDGELAVGQAVIVETDHERFPWLISAPTMRVPMNVAETTNAMLAFRAVLRATRLHNHNVPDRPIRTVVCPGLGTGEGRMPASRCAPDALRLGRGHRRTRRAARRAGGCRSQPHVPVGAGATLTRGRAREPTRAVSPTNSRSGAASCADVRSRAIRRA